MGWIVGFFKVWIKSRMNLIVCEWHLSPESVVSVQSKFFIFWVTARRGGEQPSEEITPAFQLNSRLHWTPTSLAWGLLPCHQLRPEPFSLSRLRTGSCRNMRSCRMSSWPPPWPGRWSPCSALSASPCRRRWWCRWGRPRPLLGSRPRQRPRCQVWPQA